MSPLHCTPLVNFGQVSILLIYRWSWFWLPPPKKKTFDLFEHYKSTLYKNVLLESSHVCNMVEKVCQFVAKEASITFLKEIYSTCRNGCQLYLDHGVDIALRTRELCRVLHFDQHNEVQIVPHVVLTLYMLFKTHCLVVKRRSVQSWIGKQFTMYWTPKQFNT